MYRFLRLNTEAKTVSFTRTVEYAMAITKNRKPKSSVFSVYWCNLNERWLLTIYNPPIDMDDINAALKCFDKLGRTLEHQSELAKPAFNPDELESLYQDMKTPDEPTKPDNINNPAHYLSATHVWWEW